MTAGQPLWPDTPAISSKVTARTDKHVKHTSHNFLPYKNGCIPTL